MKDISSIDYSAFDRKEILTFLFYPRKEEGWERGADSHEELVIPVEGGETVGGRFYGDGAALPNMLFFHGNGEIVADYADLAPLYVKLGVNFIPVDYRGYGRSTGSPTVTGMMRDCHSIFDFVKNFLKGKGFSGPLVVMGRSLGSASALELAAHYPDEVKALVVESGFAYIIPLLRLLGVNAGNLGITEEGAFNHTAKIKKYKNPLLVIHAEHDHIIPFADGEALFKAAESPDKEFLAIKHANHNNIFQYGLREYIAAVGSLLKKIAL
jgi:pimeloyl-ACP methyl ester carboxylesterase